MIFIWWILLQHFVVRCNTQYLINILYLKSIKKNIILLKKNDYLHLVNIVVHYYTFGKTFWKYKSSAKKKKINGQDMVTWRGRAVSLQSPWQSQYYVIILNLKAMTNHFVEKKNKTILVGAWFMIIVFVRRFYKFKCP